MAQLLSRFRSFHRLPHAAKLSQGSPINNVMTATPGTAMGLPKLKAKTFALALLPFALALTGCGGSASDDSGTTDTDTTDTDCAPGTTYNNDTKQCVPTTEPEPEPDLGMYKEQFEFLEALADPLNKDVPIYKLLPNRPGWMINYWMYSKEIKDLRDAYNATLTGGKDPFQSNEQKDKYLELVQDVQKLAYDTYKLEYAELDNLRNYAFVTIGQDTVSNQYYASANTGTDAQASAILQAIDDRYDITNNAPDDRWGNSNLLTLRGLRVDNIDRSNGNGTDNSYEEFGKIFLGLREGTFDDDASKYEKYPTTQLSFYHGSGSLTGETTIYSGGVDFLHMKSVSFFLHYFAQTDESISDQDNNHYDKYDFMTELAEEGESNTWRVQATVDGVQPSAANNMAWRQLDPITATETRQDLTYMGTMLAGTLTENAIPGQNDTTGVMTYMGDAKVILDFDAPATQNPNVDIMFTNILPTKDYLDGLTGGGQIVFMDAPLDDTSNHAFFGNQSLGFPGDDNPDNRTGVRGQFYGPGDTANAATINTYAGNYGGRDAVGGVFASQLTNGSGTRTLPSSDFYMGVFGAQATKAQE